MELFFDSYEKNPFEEELEYRIEGASDMDAKAMYRLFVKNLVAFVYYETSCPFAFEFYSGYQAAPATQDIIYGRFFKGVLLTRIDDPVAISPLLSFCDHEYNCFYDIHSKDCDAYIGFIDSYRTVFTRIDALVNLFDRQLTGEDFVAYLSSNNLTYPFLYLEHLGSMLEKLFINACHDLCVSYLTYFDERDFFSADFSADFIHVRLAMKLDLLDEQGQIDIVKHSHRWLSYNFKKIALNYDITVALLPTSETFLFASVLEKYTAYFSAITSLSSFSKDFPKYVFSSYEGYLLFDTLAKGLYTKVAVSYVYRFLLDKGFIVVKDSSFREWYNTQNYPIRLESVTETLQKSTSSDREQFVAIVANLLGIPL